MTTTPTREELRELKRRKQANELRVAILQQESVLEAAGADEVADIIERNLAIRHGGLPQGKSLAALEGYYDPSNFVDLQQYRMDLGERGYQSFASTYTTRSDRQDGRNFPYWVSEPELALMRGISRILCFYNPTATGVLEKLASYTVGSTGLQYRAGTKHDAPKDLVTAVQDVIDAFCERNDLIEADHETFIRGPRDGECWEALYHRGDGVVDLRYAEPDQATMPSNPREIEEWLYAVGEQEPGLPFVSNWSFGCHTTEGDVQESHGYYVQWTYNDQDWDYFPGGVAPCYPPTDRGQNTWMQFLKRNTDRNIKRGFPDFYATANTFELSRKLLRNMGQGTALQAAIAWIKEVPAGTPQATAQSDVMAKSDWSYQSTTAQGGKKTHYTQQYDPGSVLYTKGANYKPGPMATEAGKYFTGVSDALLRSLAVRWAMPEHMLTGSAENNNMASIMVAGHPFVRHIESEQQKIKSHRLKQLWKIIWFAYQSGIFRQWVDSWQTLKRIIELNVEAPRVEVDNKDNETKRRAILNANGILSDEDWATQEGLDYQEQVKKGAKKQGLGKGVGAGIGGGGMSGSGASESVHADSVESYQDPSVPQENGIAGDAPEAVAPASPIIDLPDVRQPNHWSCGAAASMAVGRHFGVGPQTIEEWENALGTTEAKSTSPQAIIDYLKGLGLSVDARQELSLLELGLATSSGQPVICPVQDYMNQRSLQAAWNYGHWLTVVGIVPGYVVCQDSSIDNAEHEPGGDVSKKQADDPGNIAAPGRVMIRQADWLKAWHDVGEDGTKYVRFGIIVGQPAMAATAKESWGDQGDNAPAAAMIQRPRGGGNEGGVVAANTKPARGGHRNAKGQIIRESVSSVASRLSRAAQQDWSGYP